MNGLRIHNRCTCSIDDKRLENPLLIRSCLVPDLPQYSTNSPVSYGQGHREEQ